MSRHKTKDVIVLIPGICGSVFTKDGKEIWGTSAASIFRALKSAGDSVQNLKLDGDDPKAEDLGDKVTAAAWWKRWRLFQVTGRSMATRKSATS